MVWKEDPLSVAATHLRLSREDTAGRASPELVEKVAHVVEEGLEGVSLSVYIHLPIDQRPRAVWEKGIRRVSRWSTMAGAAPEAIALSGNMMYGTLDLDTVTVLLNAEEVRYVELDLGGELELETSAPLLGVGAFATQLGVSGKGVVIAVLDDMVNNSHPALTHVQRKRSYSPAEWSPSSDFVGHATLVAGIAGGTGVDSGPRGIAPEATLWNYRIIPMPRDENGKVRSDGVYRAIREAADDGAHIINLSWGQTTNDLTAARALCEAVEYADAMGVIVVKSAGNRGHRPPPNITVPANSPSCVVVGATSNDGRKIWDSSSWGAISDSLVRPDLVAPGVDIDGPAVGGGYAQGPSGTSFAAPHVAGLVALLKQAYTRLSHRELVERLFSICQEPSAFIGAPDRRGRGIPDLRRLL